MLKNIIKAILVLLFISAATVYPFTSTWQGLVRGMVACIVLQIVIYNIYKGFRDVYLEKVKNEREKQLANRGTYVTCPCPREKRDFIPVSFTEDNNYTCLHCNKRVAVTCEIKTFLTTEPLPLEGAAEALLLKAQKQILSNK